MCMGEVETTAFASYRFFPRDPSTDAPFLSLFLFIPREPQVVGELRDARLLCRARRSVSNSRGGGLSLWLGAEIKPRGCPRKSGIWWMTMHWRADASLRQKVVDLGGVCGPQLARCRRAGSCSLLLAVRVVPRVQSFVSVPPGAARLIFGFFPADIRVILMFHRPRAEKGAALSRQGISITTTSLLFPYPPLQVSPPPLNCTTQGLEVTEHPDISPSASSFFPRRIYLPMTPSSCPPLSHASSFSTLLFFLRTHRPSQDARRRCSYRLTYPLARHP
jgi:hypothetical protein